MSPCEQWIDTSWFTWRIKKSSQGADAYISTPLGRGIATELYTFYEHEIVRRVESESESDIEQNSLKFCVDESLAWQGNVMMTRKKESARFMH